MVPLRRTGMLPGLPTASYALWRWAHVNDLLDHLQVERAPSNDSDRCVNVYLVSLKGRTIARYTVRNHVSAIERNLFWFPPDDIEFPGADQIVSMGVAGDVVHDALRIASEKVQLFVFYHLRDSHRIWRETTYLPRAAGVRGSIEVSALHELAHVTWHSQAHNSGNDEAVTPRPPAALGELAESLSTELASYHGAPWACLALYSASNHVVGNTTLAQCFLDFDTANSFSSYKATLIDIILHGGLHDQPHLDWDPQYQSCRAFVDAFSDTLPKLPGRGSEHKPSIEVGPSLLDPTRLAMLVADCRAAFDSPHSLSQTSKAYDRVISAYSESSPITALLLCEAVTLANPLMTPQRLSQHVFASIRNLVKSQYDLEHHQDAFALAVALTDHLTVQVNVAKERCNNYGVWKACLFSLIPHLLLASRLFETAKALFQRAGYEREATDCATRQLLVEEWYCDTWAVLACNGVGHQAILPFMELAFINEEQFPDCDTACYERALHVVLDSLTSRILIPRFVFEEIASIVADLQSRVAVEDALHPPRTSYKRLLEINKANGITDRRVAAKQRREQFDNVVKANRVFRRLLRPYPSLSRYIDAALRERLKYGDDVESSFCSRMFDAAKGRPRDAAPSKE